MTHNAVGNKLHSAVFTPMEVAHERAPSVAFINTLLKLWAGTTKAIHISRLAKD
jgi:hypothetical protein